MRLVLVAALVSGFLAAAHASAQASHKQRGWSEPHKQVCMRKQRAMRLDFWLF